MFRSFQYFLNKQCQMGAFTAGVWSYFSAKAPGHFGVNSYFYNQYIAPGLGSEPRLPGRPGLNRLFLAALKAKNKFIFSVTGKMALVKGFGDFGVRAST